METFEKKLINDSFIKNRFSLLEKLRKNVKQPTIKEARTIIVQGIRSIDIK